MARKHVLHVYCLLWGAISYSTDPPGVNIPDIDRLVFGNSCWRASIGRSPSITSECFITNVSFYALLKCVMDRALVVDPNPHSHCTASPRRLWIHRDATSRISINEYSYRGTIRIRGAPHVQVLHSDCPLLRIVSVINMLDTRFVDFTACWRSSPPPSMEHGISISFNIWPALIVM